MLRGELIVVDVGVDGDRLDFLSKRKWGICTEVGWLVGGVLEGWLLGC